MDITRHLSCTRNQQPRVRTYEKELTGNFRWHGCPSALMRSIHTYVRWVRACRLQTRHSLLIPATSPIVATRRTLRKDACTGSTRACTWTSTAWRSQDPTKCLPLRGYLMRYANNRNNKTKFAISIQTLHIADQMCWFHAECLSNKNICQMLGYCSETMKISFSRMTSNTLYASEMLIL